MKRTRLYQYTKSACYKQKSGRGRTTRVTAEDYDEVPEVCAVSEQSDMNAVLKEMAEQRTTLDKLLLSGKPSDARPTGVLRPETLKVKVGLAFSARR